MVKNIAFIFLLLLYTKSTFGQIGRLPLSPLQTLEQKIAKTDINVIYSRPAMRGRKIFGGLVPFNFLWRTGANKNTKISFSKDVIIGKQRLKKGTYAIFSKPKLNNWEIYFYTDINNWDVPEKWEPSKIAAQITVPSINYERVAESFTITIDNITNNILFLSIFWDTTLISIPIRLTTEELMRTTIDKILNGPHPDDFYLAAHYTLETGKNYNQALNWINKAIKLRDKPNLWDYQTKSLILSSLKNNPEAIEAANYGLKLAQNDSNQYGIQELTKILKELKN